MNGSEQPPARHATRSAILCGLAPGGVCHAPDIAIRAVSSYLAFSPLSRPDKSGQDGIFSVTLSVCISLRLYTPRYSRGTLLCGVRTFLIPVSRDAVARPASVCLCFS